MINYFDVQELAALMSNRNIDDIINSGDERILDEYCYEALSIEDGVEGLRRIIEKLIKFTPTWKSPLTGELYQGFVVPEGDKGLMRAIIKQKYEY
jgi:hypothetical protein